MVASNDEIRFLIVDDDDVCQLLLDRALKDLGARVPVITAVDGIEGLEVLRQVSGGGDASFPVIVLLDLRMPRMNGLEFLEVVRADPKLRGTTVFVLSTSSQRHDVEAAHSLGVAGYLVKPDDYEDFKDIIAMLSHYRRQIVLPSPRSDSPTRLLQSSGK